jgi:DNA polymerase III delta prime subunit
MLIGYEKFVDDIKRLAKNGSLSHAYLFHGENQAEIFLFVQSLANFLENGNFGKSKKLLKEILVVSPDEKNVIGIDAVKQLKNFLWQKPVNSSRRLAVVNGAQNLTPQAQHAALKIVEEPPQSALIIFIAATIEDLLPTLNSRLQKIYFPSRARIGAGKTQTNMDSPRRAALSLRESVLSDAEINDFFESLIDNLRKDPIKNSKKLKEALKRLTLLKQFNVNKRLQMRTLYE